MFKRIFFIFCLLASYSFSFESLNEDCRKNHSGLVKYVNSQNIGNNGVYFIKNLGNSRLIDVPLASYVENAQLITYNPSYFGNQRFKISREFLHDNYQTYRIRPLYDTSYVFGIENNSDLVNSKLIIKKEDYSSGSALLSDKFSFISIPGEPNTFYIKCNNLSNTNLYLSVENKNSSYNGSKIIQESFQNNDFFKWQLIETDSLYPNCVQNNDIPSLGNVYYNLKLQNDGRYRISTNFLQTRITIYDKTHENMLIDRSNVSYLEYDFLSSIDYIIRIYNLSDSQKSYDIKLIPTLTFFSYSIFDYGANNMDRTSFENMAAENFALNGYFCVVFSNLAKNKVIISDENGFSPLNSNYCSIHTHGTPGSAMAYNGLTIDDSFTYSNLPLTTNNVFTFWFSCHGASNKTIGNYTTSMARESVVRGSIYALGFKGNVITYCARSFSKNIGAAFNENKRGLQLVKRAFDLTTQDEWYYYYTSAVFYSDNAIWDPYVYFKSGNDIKYVIDNNDSPIVFNDDGGYYNNENMASLSSRPFFDVHSKEIKIIHHDEPLTLIKNGYVLTNIISSNNNEKNYIELDKCLNKYKINPLDKSKLVIVIKQDNNMIPFSIENSNGDSVVYNLSTNKQDSMESFSSLCNSFTS